MYYSAAWQLLEERIDEDCVTTPGTDRTAQEVWGLRYIDDAVMRTAAVGDEGGNERKFYHLTDVQFSTVAMLPVGALRSPVYERVGYEPYGKATHRWAGDVNNDGAVNSTDVGLVTTAAAANSGAGYTMGVHSAYDVRMDINRDGLVDGDDEDLFTALPAEAALGTGEISDRSANGPDNVFGYDGYVFAPELSRYCVRFRCYDPGTGRWMERDPAESSANLFEYCDTTPLVWNDPSGLQPEDDPHKRRNRGKLQPRFWGSWGDGFESRLRSLIDRLQHRFTERLKDLDAFETNTMAGESKCVQDKMKPQLDALRSRLTGALNLLQDSSVTWILRLAKPNEVEPTWLQRKYGAERKPRAVTRDNSGFKRSYITFVQF